MSLGDSEDSLILASNWASLELGLVGDPPGPSSRNVRRRINNLIPKEKLIAKQRVFQSLKGPVHLRGPSDKITSVAIPLAMTVTSVVLIVRGIYDMSQNIGKKEA
ncbi:hypothetical protein VitviT2T_012562 [Vitis vinifera]|uniref:Uncharacterized protein n=1 Tax=Vitis vinifera TaxID=29760 RepID=A0ABY9CGI3_VITVI|nr:hypothetical protein VitviT2T_012562 [Vitis vinifera]